MRDIGSGNVTKLANQIIVALNIALCQRLWSWQSRPALTRKRYSKPFGRISRQHSIDAKMPMVLRSEFQARFRIELHIKDLLNALETAHSVDVPLPLASQVLEYMQALKVDGKAKKTITAALIQFYEKLAKVEVKKQ